MRRTAISTRGRVTIPADLRERFGIRPGTHINWSKEQGRLVLTPTTARRWKEIVGPLKPKAGELSISAMQKREGRREKF